MKIKEKMKSPEIVYNCNNIHVFLISNWNYNIQDMDFENAQKFRCLASDDSN